MSNPLGNEQNKSPSKIANRNREALDPEIGFADETKEMELTNNVDDEESVVCDSEGKKL